jgi:hypothetical protein
MTPATQPVDATSSAERIGRYLRSDLAAMVGKRGRKPPEFYEAYPEQRREPVEPKAPKAEKPRASRKAAIADIDDDVLAAQVRAAAPAVRKLISDLLAVVGQAAPSVSATPVTEAATVSEARTVTISEPVYADPEIEADPALAG